MKIRTQLIVALLLLAVLPLTGLVTYSYVSSRRAVRATVQAEAEAMTAEMEGRLAAVKGDLQSRIDRLGGLSLAELDRDTAVDSGETTPEKALVRRWLAELGDAAPLIESFEVIPVPPRPPEPGAVAPGAAPVAPPQPHGMPSEAELESIVLEVTRQVEEVHEEIVELGIAEGIQRGVEVAVAMAEAFAPLAEAAAADGETHGETDGEADRGAETSRAAAADAETGTRQRHPTIRWLARLRDRSQAAESDAVAETRRRDLAELRQRLAERRKRAELVLGEELDFQVRHRGAPVGWVKPQLSAPRLLQQVLRQARRDQGEVPFALDADDNLYVADEADREVLAALPIGSGSEDVEAPEDWVIVSSKDQGTGLSFGIARPIGETLAAVDHAARRNLAYGLGLITLAIAGVWGLSTRMTRNLRVLTEGAERIAQGDLQTRVPVRSRDELGQLARSFNRMAGDLSQHQERLLREERRRRDDEVERQILEADNARKTQELEEARQFQLSLLPRTLPSHPGFELAVHMETAAEVGGDYYDFRLTEDGGLIAAVGDATGHGARAGTMVTVIKSLFSAATSHSGLSGFLRDASRAIQRMELGRMNMALVLAELRDRTLTVSSAGMPPVLLHRAAPTEEPVEEIAIEGMPLGTFASTYRERRLKLSAGDTLLLMSDGFPELLGSEGEPLGYDQVRQLFAGVAERQPQRIVDELAAAVAEWTDGQPPADDVTFVVLRIR